MKTNLIKLTCGLALLGAAATAPAQSLIDIQFNYESRQQTGAAVIGQSGDYWNLLTTGFGTSSLMNSADVSSGVSFTWTSSSPGIASFSSSFGGGAANLMGGYIYNIESGSHAMSFANLSADTSYTLYIYTQGDSASGGRETSVTSGTTYTTTPTVAGATTFIAGQNYLEITSTTDGSGNLSFTYQPAVNEADINGIQLSITSVPEPSTLALGGLGGLLLFRRRK